jgi:hypothetical protein
MVVPGTKCSQKIFQKFFRFKNKVFGPVQIPKKKRFFEFFSSISWGNCTGTKKGFRILEEKKFNFSILVQVLNPKSTTFSPLGSVQSPQEIEKIKKKFFGVFVPVQIPHF